MIDQEIQSRMDAFRGNPQALMQRYSQNQQLIDLLALQKLKSEKEAAMRQMQMQAGQGQMPTVAQQREQELMGMAKQEVADRVGQVAQQQAKQQQENLQRAAQTGIAQAPAPNMMPAQAMASGGIVAFAGGGDTGVKTIEQLQKEYEDARAAGDFQEASRLFRVIKARKELAPRTVTVPVAEMGGAPTAPAAPGVPPGAAPPPAAQMQGGLPPPGLTQGQGLQLPPRPGAGAMPAGAPQAQGIAQAVPPTAGAQLPTPAQPGGLQAAYEQAGIGALTAKPEAAGMSAEEAYAKRFDPLFQQQLALKQQGLAEAQRLAERERAMRDPLMAWMAGARGRTIGEVLGNAGRAGMEYQQQGLTRDQALAQQLQALQEAQLGAQITQEKEKYGVGEARRKEAVGEREKAFTGVGPYLSREAQVAASIENAALRAQLGVDEKTANMIRQRMAAEEKNIDAKYAKDPRAMQAKFDLAVAAQLKRDRDEEYQKRKREIYAEFDKEPPEEAGITSAAPGTGAKTIPFSQLKSAGK